MARYLLDTTIVSFVVKETFPSLDHRVCTAIQDGLGISTVVEAEVRFGLELLPANANIRPVAENFLQAVTIFPWDSMCAQQYALLNAKQQRLGKTLATMDTMIAAHALAHDFVLVSNDAAFRRIKGLKLEDWTKGSQRG